MSRTRKGKVFLTLEEVERLCPPCADMMRQKGQTSIREDLLGAGMATTGEVLLRLKQLVEKASPSTR